MRLRVNERERDVAQGSTAGDAARELKPGADLLILNGFPASEETTLSEGDRLVLIRRGETPTAEEFETLLTARHTPGVHEAVRRARVGIAGLGGLGSQVAVALARVGVGRLTLVDFDLVEPSNLNRQHYFIPQLGKPKTEALAETLRLVNPFVTLDLFNERITRDNVARLFEGCAVLVEAFDVAAEKAMLVETALTRLPSAVIVAASGVAGFGTTDTVRVHRVSPRLVVVGDLATEARPGEGLMAPRVGVAAHAQANTVLRLLLGETP